MVMLAKGGKESLPILITWGGKIFGSCNCPGWKDDGDPLDDTAHRLIGNVDKRWIYRGLNKALIAIEKYVKANFIRNLALF